MVLDLGECYSPTQQMFSLEEGESLSMGNDYSNWNNKKREKMMRKRRFSDQQVKSLETIFQNETKLEPKKKVEVARELGLQPRQVAIWFQNKRARFKSKVMERDYNALSASYNALLSQFDTLKQEKQALLTQVQKLRKQATVGMEDGPDNNECDNKDETQLFEKENCEKLDDQKKGDNVNEPKPTMSLEGSEPGGSMVSEEGSSENDTRYNYLGMEEGGRDIEMLSMVDPTLATPCWDDLHSDQGLFDEAVDSYQWWDFWS